MGAINLIDHYSDPLSRAALEAPDWTCPYCGKGFHRTFLSPQQFTSRYGYFVPLKIFVGVLRKLAEGHFPPGSMGPKIEAALAYLERGGKLVIITSPEKIPEALQGMAGTRITLLPEPVQSVGHQAA